MVGIPGDDLDTLDPREFISSDQTGDNTNSLLYGIPLGPYNINIIN